MEEKLDKLFAYVVEKRLEYEEMLDARPWDDSCRGAIEALEDIEEEIRNL